MIRLQAIRAVFRFESRRMLVPSRLVVGLLLMLFPIGMVALMQFQGGNLDVYPRAAIALFILVPQVLCLLGSLLWATPGILAELEGRTWSYLAVRPAGKGSILLGKYLAAVTSTAVVGLISLTVSIFIVQPEKDFFRIWGVLAVLTLLSSLAYGALFQLLGVIFLRRAMAMAVAYTVALEVVITMIPAMINQLTVQYYLRNMAVQWLTLDKRVLDEMPIEYFSKSPAWQHLFVLIGFIAVLLTAAVFILRQRELIKADEE